METDRRAESVAPRAACACGCGGIPSGRSSLYLSGHDARRLNRPGCVYAMRPMGGGAIKLGHAEDPASRLVLLQRWPGELELIWKANVPNVKVAERAIHTRFAAERIHRKAEWFLLPDDFDPTVLGDLVRDLFSTTALNDGDADD